MNWALEIERARIDTYIEKKALIRKADLNLMNDFGTLKIIIKNPT